MKELKGIVLEYEQLTIDLRDTEKKLAEAAPDGTKVNFQGHNLFLRRSSYRNVIDVSLAKPKKDGGFPLTGNTVFHGVCIDDDDLNLGWI